MNARPFAPADYPMVCEWWTGHKWPSPPIDYLPQMGLITCDEEKAYAAGWLYRTDSKFCLLEWVVADPLADREKRSLAVDLLIEKLIDKAKEEGFGAIFSSIRNASLLKRYEKQGFQITDTGMTNLLRRVA